MMGLAAKSSTKEEFFDELRSLEFQENGFLQLASAFSMLAKSRLTRKQLFLLFATRQALRYHPDLSLTGLAEYLSRKWQLPLSTAKFNLKTLRDAGLLETRSTTKRRTTLSLSFGGQLLLQLLPEPNTM